MQRFAKPAAMATLFAALAVVLAVLITPAPAGELLDRYVARLSAADHYNSKGVRLDNPAAIIRQDRANFHKYGKRDPEDQSDRYFATAKNRQWLENMLRGSRPPAGVRNEIVNGTPLVEVIVYDDAVQVVMGAGGNAGAGGTGIGGLRPSGSGSGSAPMQFPTDPAAGANAGVEK